MKQPMFDKNHNRKPRAKTSSDFAAAISAFEKLGAPYTNRLICKLWIETHCAPPRSERVNFEMTSKAFAHDVRRWAKECTGRHYVVTPGDFCYAAITGLHYAWLEIGTGFDTYYFATYPRRNGVKA